MLTKVIAFYKALLVDNLHPPEKKKMETDFEKIQCNNEKNFKKSKLIKFYVWPL